MTYTPLVTIAIPTYNRADGFLPQAIEAALSQTYPELEVIVSDNCSTDHTPQLLGKYRDERLRYIRHKENIGAANNFNACLDSAKGAYFLLLHDDDLIDADFISECMEKAGGSTRFGFIRTGVRIIDENSTVKRETPNRAGGLAMVDFLRTWFSGKTSIYLCSTLFNTQKLREIGGFQSKMNLLQDCYAIVKLAAAYPRADVEAPKASFRKHGGEITFAVNVKDWCVDFLGLADLMADVLTNGDREMIAMEGRRFFSKLCYMRASAVSSGFNRFKAYVSVYRKFGFKYIPPPITEFQNRIRRKFSRALNLIRKPI